MHISTLQEFLRSLVRPLAVAGISATAEKSVASSLEGLAASLEPFKDLTAEQLAGYLKVAEEYRRTGQLPEWVLAKQPVAPKPRAPKAPKITPAEAVERLRELQHRAGEVPAETVAEAVQSLGQLTIPELKIVQKEFLGAAVGKKKDEILKSLSTKIDSFRTSRERAEGILAS
jgi:hypothetical protein